MKESIHTAWATSLGIIAVVAAICFCALRGCQYDRDAFVKCVQATQKPIECEVARRGAR